MNKFHAQKVQMGMKIFAFAVLLFGLSFQGSLNAAEPTSELNEDLAKRLIADVMEIAANTINVATVIDGTKRSEDGFTERDVRRVTAVHPVLEEGRMIRRVRCYEFSWSQKYGWFYKEIHTTRSGEEVRIWSETEGKSVVK